MAVSNIVRNLRDGELLLKDGSTPAKTLTVVLDEGDLSWTERTRTIEVKDRGSIERGHLRKGDDEAVSLSFSSRWTQLIGRSLAPADPLQLYEFLTLNAAAGLQSTSPAGQQETLDLEFTVLDPARQASERITFAKVYRETLVMSEAADGNTIAFTGKAFQTAPEIRRA